MIVVGRALGRLQGSIYDAHIGTEYYRCHRISNWFIPRQSFMSRHRNNAAENVIGIEGQNAGIWVEVRRIHREVEYQVISYRAQVQSECQDMYLFAKAGGDQISLKDGI
jgi:hypothetical protein